MDPSQLLEIANRGGTFGLVAIVAVGALRKWWYPPWYVAELARRLQDLEDDRNRWKEMAIAGLQTASRAVTAATQTLPR